MSSEFLKALFKEALAYVDKCTESCLETHDMLSKLRGCTPSDPSSSERQALKEACHSACQDRFYESETAFWSSLPLIEDEKDFYNALRTIEPQTAHTTGNREGLKIFKDHISCRPPSPAGDASPVTETDSQKDPGDQSAFQITYGASEGVGRDLSVAETAAVTASLAVQGVFAPPANFAAVLSVPDFPVQPAAVTSTTHKLSDTELAKMETDLGLLSQVFHYKNENGSMEIEFRSTASGELYVFNAVEQRFDKLKDSSVYPLLMEENPSHPSSLTKMVATPGSLPKSAVPAAGAGAAGGVGAAAIDAMTAVAPLIGASL